MIGIAKPKSGISKRKKRDMKGGAQAGRKAEEMNGMEEEPIEDSEEEGEALAEPPSKKKR